MRTLPAEQMAVREADSSRKTRENPRESFERHVKPDRTGADEGASRANRPDLSLSAKPEIDVTPRESVAVVDKLPLMPTDALFGSGSRIYPEGLAVIGYLSMVAAVAGASTAGAAGSPTAGPPTNGTTATLPSPSSSPSSSAATEQSETAARLRSPVTAQTVVSHNGATEDAADAADAPAAATGAAELPTWLSRRVFFVGQGASTTLRLRDYRIRDPGDRELVDQLIGFANGQGQTVLRIVINGNEVWRRDGMDIHNNEQGVTRHGS